MKSYLFVNDSSLNSCNSSAMPQAQAERVICGQEGQNVACVWIFLDIIFKAKGRKEHFLVVFLP